MMAVDGVWTFLEDLFVGIWMSNFQEHFLKTIEAKKKPFLIFAQEIIKSLDSKFWTLRTHIQA